GGQRNALATERGIGAIRIGGRKKRRPPYGSCASARRGATQCVGHRARYRCTPPSAAGKAPAALRLTCIGALVGQRHALAAGRGIGAVRRRRSRKTPTALRLMRIG